MAGACGSKGHGARLRFVVFDVPDELSPLVEPSQALALDMLAGRLEGIVLKRRALPRRPPCRLVRSQGPFVVRTRSVALRKSLNLD